MIEFEHLPAAGVDAGAEEGNGSGGGVEGGGEGEGAGLERASPRLCMQEVVKRANVFLFVFSSFYFLTALVGQ